MNGSLAKCRARKSLQDRKNLRTGSEVLEFAQSEYSMQYAESSNRGLGTAEDDIDCAVIDESKMVSKE